MWRLCWQLGASMVQNQMLGRVEASWMGNMLSDKVQESTIHLNHLTLGKCKGSNKALEMLIHNHKAQSFVAIWSHIECTVNKRQLS